MKKNAIKLTGLACIVALCMALAACAPAAEPKTAGDESGDAATEMAETGDGTGAYVSDEQCLSCHGGSFEALAETTADYGLSNPHGSIHGAPVSCVNCHAKDKELTDNQCTKCHSWPHNPETDPGVALN
ncbi:cytochrome c3 family protein [Adlercreutzia equolifaciens]|uniref:cytochrome c3 family protein n=1 Tax=Adlercreutzia equolifaciens TaxID=446660 RepID=UPI00266B80A4|nr:cytochrome c3 family protein [Adlercreutzia equolifaciens]